MRHPTTSAVVCSGSAAQFGALRAEAAEEPLCTCMVRLSVAWLARSPPTITTTSTSVASGRKMEMHGITVCIRVRVCLWVPASGMIVIHSVRYAQTLRAAQSGRYCFTIQKVKNPYHE